MHHPSELLLVVIQMDAAHTCINGNTSYLVIACLDDMDAHTYTYNLKHRLCYFTTNLCLFNVSIANYGKTAESPTLYLIPD